MKTNTDLFEKAPVPKAVATMAVPTMISMLVVVIYNMADTFFIGQTKDPLQVAAVSLATPVFMIFMALGHLFGIGGSSAISRALGERRKDRAWHISSFCCYGSLGLGVMVAVISVLGMEQILHLIGASENTIDYAAAYMSVYAIGTVFVQLTLGMNAFITAQGFAQIGMRTVLIGAVANIVLDPLFIFALNMGVRGAALATIISQCLSCVWVLRFLTGPKTMLRLKKENIRIAPALVLPCVALGSATFIM